MRGKRDARDKRHFLVMSALAILVIILGLGFEQKEEEIIETNGTRTVTVRDGAVTDAAVLTAPSVQSASLAEALPSPEDGIYSFLQGSSCRWKFKSEHLCCLQNKCPE